MITFVSTYEIGGWCSLHRLAFQFAHSVPVSPEWLPRLFSYPNRGEALMAAVNGLRATYFVSPTGTVVPRASRYMPAKLRLAILERDGFTCQLCGNGGLRRFGKGHPRTAEIDHLVPLSRGGQTHAANLRTLCRRCNRCRSNGVSR